MTAAYATDAPDLLPCTCTSAVASSLLVINSRSARLVLFFAMTSPRHSATSFTTLQLQFLDIVLEFEIIKAVHTMIFLQDWQDMTTQVKPYHVTPFAYITMGYVLEASSWQSKVVPQLLLRQRVGL